MFAVGGLIKKAKAMIPKVANVAKKAVSTVSKAVNAVKNSAVGKAVASIPSKINTAKAKAQATTQKVVATIPKVVNAVQKTNKAIVNKAVQKGVQINSAVQTKLNEINEKNQRILDNIKAEGDIAFSRIIKGTLTVGACPTSYPIVSSSIVLDFLLQSRKAVIEEYPFLEWQQKNLKRGLSFVEDQAKKANDFIGSTVYNANIPMISDTVGAFTGQRDPDAKSNGYSFSGSFYRGLLIKGAVGTVDALANVAADPYEALEGLNSIVLSPETMLPAIGDEIGKFFKEKILEGSPDDWAEVSGQAVFEIAQYVIGTGEVKTGSTIAKMSGDMTKGLKFVKATSMAEKTLSASKYLETYLIKNLGKTLDSALMKSAQKSGDFLDDLRFMLKQNSKGMVPSYAGMGVVDDFIGTGEMLKDGLSKLKAKFMKPESPGGNGVNIKPGVASENLGDEGGKIAKGVNEGSEKTLHDINGKYTGGRTQSELDALKYDPAKKAITSGSKNEAQIGLDLEEKGIIGQLERSADPKAEFIDSLTGKKYDVKSFESTPIGSDGVPITSPRKGAFKVENAMKNVVKEFEKNGNDIVIIDKLKLIPEHVNELRNAIEEAGLTDKIIWWPE